MPPPPYKPAAFLPPPDGFYGSLPVSHLPLIPSERELVTVAVKVGLGNVVEGAMNAALEQGEKLSAVLVFTLPRAYSPWLWLTVWWPPANSWPIPCTGSIRQSGLRPVG